ncbi:MAG: phospholipase D-like domain-containing protein [bacterium]
MVLWVFRTAVAALGILSAGHALLFKRDPRAGLAWIAVCLFIPVAGPLTYWIFGVNRIQTRARQYHARWSILVDSSGESRAAGTGPSWDPRAAGMPGYLRPLVHTADAVTRRPLMPGNRVDPLFGGEACYPLMEEAIESATDRVLLTTYIFDPDRTGTRIIRALRRAIDRGVEVKVMLDGFGEWYSRPRVRGTLEELGVPYEVFLPFSLIRSRLHINLRNHRKILAVDGETGFTGGINISDRHLASDPGNAMPVQDVHFRLQGPVVQAMEQAFLEDWAFVTGETYEPEPLATPEENEPAVCRAISDGPNEDFEKLQWILLGALTTAREHVRIMTPYFVPDRVLIAALNSAALRGARVEVVLPEENDHPAVDWASRAMLWEMLDRGVRFFYQPPPFAHTKLFVLDQDYVLAGSANLDNRSLRLNFEFNVEIYDRRLAIRLGEYFDEVRDASREVSLEEMDGRPLPQRLRDAGARLFAPYL